jgi:hypothetical protein
MGEITQPKRSRINGWIKGSKEADHTNMNVFNSKLKIKFEIFL